MIQVYVYYEDDTLFVQTLGDIFHLHPEGFNIDKKIIEIWFHAFSQPMLNNYVCLNLFFFINF